MQAILFTVLGIVLGAVVVFVLLRKNGRGDESRVSDNGGILLLQNQFNEMGRHLEDLTKTLDQKMGESAKIMHESIHRQFGQSHQLIKEITEELTHVKDTGRRVEGFAEQLQDLQDILKNPKQRGILGEYYLENLLGNVLPTGSYQMQYPFNDGTIVDAVVFVKDKIIPIDSKFSLENYNRLTEEKDPLEKERLEKAFRSDLKNRIDETSKYVKPSENTMDFAFMFIPHEAIYYDLLISQVGAVKVNTRDLVEYAFKEKHVIIVSPTSFLAYLQTVLQGLKALQIEESAKHIKANVENLQKHLKAYEEYHGKLGNALGVVVNHYNLSGKEFKKIDKDMLRITNQTILDEIPILDKPDTNGA